MRDDCIGELAELYALGELSDIDRARIDRHARECDACAQRLGEAESAVLRMIEAGPMPERPAALDRRLRFAAGPPVPAWIAAIAAAFVLGLLPWGIGTLRHGPDPDQEARTAMLAGHFVHAPFEALTPKAPQAKVIYPREGGWLYVIAGPGADPLDVVVTRAGVRTTVASLPGSTETRSAFVAEPQGVDGIQLLQGDTPVATARIAVPPLRSLYTPHTNPEQ